MIRHSRRPASVYFYTVTWPSWRPRMRNSIVVCARSIIESTSAAAAAAEDRRLTFPYSWWMQRDVVWLACCCLFTVSLCSASSTCCLRLLVSSLFHPSFTDHHFRWRQWHALWQVCLCCCRVSHCYTAAFNWQEIWRDLTRFKSITSSFHLDLTVISCNWETRRFWFDVWKDSVHIDLKSLVFSFSKRGLTAFAVTLTLLCCNGRLIENRPNNN